MYAHMEQSSAKRKASELGEEEASDETEAKRKKDSHSNMAVTSECVSSIIGMRPNVEATTPLKRPASPTDEESLGDLHIIKRMRLPGGPLLKLVRSKAPCADRIPTHSAMRRSHMVTGAIVGSPSSKDVHSLLPDKERPRTSLPTHSADSVTHTLILLPTNTPSAARPRKQESRQDTVQRDTSGKV